tara:strand:+ start:1912 stop:2097 length:186 start_codon:yes stop_codon:yes gene_type:complete
VANVRQAAMPDKPLDDARHVNVEKWLGLAVLEHQDRVRDVLPDRRDIAVLLGNFGKLTSMH